VFRAEVSLHEWEEGEAGHSADIVPPRGPEGLVSMREIVAANADAVGPVTVRRVCGRDAMDYHVLEPEKGLLVQGDRPAMSGWIVPHDPPPPDDAVAFYASLAYMADGFSNASCRMTHSLNIYAGELLSVSLNHAMWFHCRPRPIDKVFCAMESPFAGGGLGWNRGMFYDADGCLLASIVQDSLIRRPARATPEGVSNP
jgi:acyl-CoA thioesterase-2